MSTMAIDAVILDERDNVATTLRAIAAGETVQVRGPAGIAALVAGEAIPLCHKLALMGLEDGAQIVKYGAVIGQTTRKVSQGGLVHVHNMQSLRARH